MKSSRLILVVSVLSSFFLSGCAAGVSGPPERTTTSQGEIKKAPEKELIRVQSPQPGAVVRPPLLVRGEARGPWYFEGDFPLILKDARGNILSRGFASAQGEWMTTDFVPFSGRLEFTPPAGAEGELVLQKDNPSGLRELDDSVIIPVVFE